MGCDCQLFIKESDDTDDEQNYNIYRPC